MTEKEIQIYTSGKENPNAYVFRRRIFYNLKKSIKKLHIRKKYIVYFFIVGFLSCIIGALLFFKIFTIGELYSALAGSGGIERKDSNFTIYYLDVGQGDCSIIICDDVVMMIDTATVNHKSEIYNALLALDIDEIDYLLITHQHDDHMGNAESIIEKYSVKNIIMPSIGEGYDVDSYFYENLLKSIAKNGVNPISASSCNSFKLGSADVDILSPNKHYDDLNDMSIVLKITYGDTSFLFQGDASKKVEKQLINDGVDVSADILKVGHHGSNVSTTETYLSYVNPSACIISYGAGNNFHHPNHNVIDRLEDKNVDIFLTLYHGNITVVSDGNTITIYSQKNQETKIYK